MTHDTSCHCHLFIGVCAGTGGFPVPAPSVAKDAAALAGLGRTLPGWRRHGVITTGLWGLLATAPDWVLVLLAAATTAGGLASLVRGGRPVCPAIASPACQGAGVAEAQAVVVPEERQVVLGRGGLRRRPPSLLSTGHPEPSRRNDAAVFHCEPAPMLPHARFEKIRSFGRARQGGVSPTACDRTVPRRGGCSQGAPPPA
mmetsp:Transcript_10405/g.29740  ORF Transcript_10405/g.29740 Transcript_10405/m.29740 type:complete len:200 (-) Transcript_10405:716-1315(-)